MSSKFRFAIDRGGTFTDVYAKCPNGNVRTLKLLSEDPTNYADAPTEGIRRILEEETGEQIPKSSKISGGNIGWIRMGTTVATNALLERKGERTALVITKGFKDLLYIGNQSRPKIFDLAIVRPDVLYEDVVEVDCRIIPQMKGKCHLPESSQWPVIEGLSSETFYCVKSVPVEEIEADLCRVFKKGIRSVAVVLIHSYMYQEHEIQIGEIARKIGFTNVSLSHQVMPMVKMVNRGYTTCADAYLTPHIQNYVKGFASGFQKDLEGVNVLFMQSDGGLTPMNSFNGSRAVLSGPAGGVVGYAKTTPVGKPVIGFDMGGTSTDVSRFAGHFEHVFESTVADITIQAPQLDINTVAAGGGSRLFFRSGLFVVGPESASAHPGPVCYRKNGFLTVTDANLVLGRVIPEYFPKIFGPDEKQPLDKAASLAAFEKLKTEINVYLTAQGSKHMTVEEVAMGFVKVANESMCRPIRALTQGKGYETKNHILACFGGAGGQHACAIARELGMAQVAVHKYAGILSAFGMACADVVHEEQEPCSLVYDQVHFQVFSDRINLLRNICVEKLKDLGFSKESIVCETFFNLRYQGTDGSLMISSGTLDSQSHPDIESFKTAFLKRYQSEFGFTLPDRNLLVDDIRVRGIGQSRLESEQTISKSGENPVPEQIVSVYFEPQGFVPTGIYQMSNLSFGQILAGPAVLMDGLSTLVVEPGCAASITETGNVIIDVNVSQRTVGPELDAIQLSIFSHRFMSIAEQMGRVLQRTAISTNIKERLDFSCALFGPDGGLVSNAPHIPVHLGSMQETVQYQMNALGDDLQEGDVILSNHPKAGGSHLPDLTVITPVFTKGIEKPVFFVASRGHHADIGGITPGSMPPHSKALTEEGASFKSFHLVYRGHFREKELTDELMKPAQYPGSTGTRNLHDNIADLKAQIAANHKGINLVKELIDSYGLEVVQNYMGHIQRNAAAAVQDVLRTIGNAQLREHGTSTLSAIDYLDDSSPIKLKISIDVEKGTAICDFTGSGYEVWGNCNAPKAITLSALIYCLRCMVGHDVPLNQGCLAPITTVIPPGSILDPSSDAAVVGGNVQTSQRIVDVVLKAFQVCAASQGCMNNITFGQKDWGYYETVAGGAGAGPTWHGHSGVHTHMTNTRITDPEILERRYPVILEKFSLREGSGGDGAHPGGNGVQRVLKFRDQMSLSILTERRVFEPYGMNGGHPGKKGLNLLYRKDGRIIFLGSKTAVMVDPGDVFQLLTPGGGGWGIPGSAPCTLAATTPSVLKGSLHDYVTAQESS